MVPGTTNKNSNISQVIWKVRGRERQAYSLTYDYLNRMTAARYDNLNDAGTAVNNTNAWNENLSYDIRGNINTLTRTGKYKTTPTATCWTDGQIDNLAYTYNANTNRLQKIADTAPAASKVQGWNNTAGAASTAQYAYDANGNMTTDPYKGMSVTYNFLNLPTRFTFAGNKIIDVLYDGGGRKLRKTVTDNGTVQYVQNYVEGIEYRTNSTVSLSLESIYHAEGRVFNTNTGTTSADALRYEYTIRDHLGNTRLMFTDKNADGKIDITTTASTEVLQENHYYPFGMNMSGPWQDDAAARNNQYQYNGKELNEDFGLGWNDYGARWYDASLGRWWSVEPLGDEIPEVSSYSYAMNDPMEMIDIDGLIPWPQIVKHKRVSSKFGMRIHPIKKILKGHGGIDLSTPEGNDVHSAASGTVVKIGWDEDGYGRYVVVEHTNGYYSLYGHLQKGGVLVKRGQPVGDGQVLALSGNTGTSTAPHLHFEIIKSSNVKDIMKKENKVDPQSIDNLQSFLFPVNFIPIQQKIFVDPIQRDNTRIQLSNPLETTINNNLLQQLQSKESNLNNEKKKDNSSSSSSGRA